MMTFPAARRATTAALAVALAAVACSARAAAPAAAPAAPGWKLDWARGAVFYEVFVRSFLDSDGDGKGDLPGLVAKLDYLNDGDPRTTTDLGVDALWLMPVFKSPSYHGYDVTDYEDVNPDYGTNADLERLIAEAHRRGMKVVLDLVLNHTSVQHPWFVAAASSPADPRRDWYLWRKEDPGWTRPWSTAHTWVRCDAKLPCNGWYYYALFWRGMPDLNYTNPDVRAEARRIAKLWLDRGVDGFRLDGARHIVEGEHGEQVDTPATHAFWREFSAYVRSVKPDALLVGEVWTETPKIAPYFGDTAKVRGGDELPMTFDFPLSSAILEALKTGDAGPLGAKLTEVQATYPRGALDAPFLTNHDQIRVATQLKGDAGALRTAAAILLTLPGAPFVYYGEELGMLAPDNSDDEFKRTPMPWDGTPNGGFTTAARPWQHLLHGHEAANVAAETGDPASLLSRYRALIALRHRSPALREGDAEVLPAGRGLLAFLRRSPGETVLVVHNVGAAAASSTLRVPGARGLEPLLVDPGVGAPAPGAAGWTVALPAHTSAAWRLAPAPRRTSP